MSTVAATVRAWAIRDVVVDRRARAGFGVCAFAFATAFGAQVGVPLPLTPVPITLQTLFVVLAGVLLGPRLGALSIGAYVAAGAVGLPVFSNGGAGLPWLLGATGGYLLAAPVAALAAGAVAGKKRTTWRTLAGLALGTAVMYAGGLAQLALLTGEPLGVVASLGLIPFLPGDAAKILVALAVVRLARGSSFRNL